MLCKWSSTRLAITGDFVAGLEDAALFPLVMRLCSNTDPKSEQTQSISTSRVISL